MNILKSPAISEKLFSMSQDLKMFINSFVVVSAENLLTEDEVTELLDIRTKLKQLAYKLKVNQ